jgi:hypothetical protein
MQEYIVTINNRTFKLKLTPEAVQQYTVQGYKVTPVQPNTPTAPNTSIVTGDSRRSTTGGTSYNKANTRDPMASTPGGFDPARDIQTPAVPPQQNAYTFKAQERANAKAASMGGAKPTVATPKATAPQQPQAPGNADAAYQQLIQETALGKNGRGYISNRDMNRAGRRLMQNYDMSKEDAQKQLDAYLASEKVVNQGRYVNTNAPKENFNVNFGNRTDARQRPEPTEVSGKTWYENTPTQNRNLQRQNRDNLMETQKRNEDGTPQATYGSGYSKGGYVKHIIKAITHNKWGT